MQGSGLAIGASQGAMLRAAALLLHLLRRLVDLTLILLLGVMVVAVLAQVAGRYLLNFSIGGATELATFAQIWMVLLGAGYAMRARLHVSIDTLVARLPPLAARLLMLPVAALCLWFLYVVFEGGMLLIEIGAIQTSAALQISMQVPYIALPVSAAYLALELALAFGATILGQAPAADLGERAD
ncbi:TRAP transporter small permease [Falsiroseomonas selenitidurans]|uniref:TRAP transporter small permease protein n=1 Tax=Falsiroseomonas selenitidurans TaxID=2716335 RepID=A0ABX1E5C1_9PROT|nr:TRAP transporter small permease subunit [Falsiroseomonas selenitidurans]NKC30130.1 TRAP transporter small permease subunit [Falsiroseomonas selenitidurans]